MEKTSRRSFITGAAAAGAALVSTTGGQAQTKTGSTSKLELKDGATILFQGDSITDAGRKKGDTPANNQEALGRGYPQFVSWHLLARYPEKKLKFLNRGISGNKVPDLERRWQKDCIDLKPDILSILIGVNDQWHTMAFGKKYKGTVESYGEGLTKLLQDTKKKLPNLQIVVCDPFIVGDAERTVRGDFYPEFDKRRAKAREAAAAVGATYVEFQKMFDAAVGAGCPHKHLAGDAIHPSPLGHGMMANRWMADTGLF